MVHLVLKESANTTVEPLPWNFGELLCEPASLQNCAFPKGPCTRMVDVSAMCVYHNSGTSGPFGYEASGHSSI